MNAIPLRSLALAVALASTSPVLVGQVPIEPDFGPSIGSATGDPPLVAMPLGFAFPLQGFGNANRVHINSNGMFYLSLNSLPLPGSATGYSNSAVTLVNNLRTGAPKVAVFWKDLDGGSMHFQTLTSPTRAVITWFGVTEVGGTQPHFLQCVLYPTGSITFAYSDELTLSSGAAMCGVSPGGGAADPGASDFSTNPTNLPSTTYELFSNSNALDLQDGGLRLTPAGAVFNASVTARPAATHTMLATGCGAETLSAGTPPIVGNAIPYVVSGVTPNTVLTVTCVSLRYFPVGLPIPGAPGCLQHVDIDPLLLTAIPAFPIGNSTVANLAIPVQAPSYVGVDLFIQAAVFDPTFNSTGLHVTNTLHANLNDH